jgi:hypothetical protein
MYTALGIYGFFHADKFYKRNAEEHSDAPESISNGRVKEETSTSMVPSITKISAMKIKVITY